MNTENTVNIIGGGTGEKRIQWIDILRAFAICCVILTHTTERVYQLNVSAMLTYSVQRQIFSISLFTIGRLGVPIFFFITGYLLLDRSYDEKNCVKFYKRNLIGLLITTEIWVIIYNCFNMWFKGSECDVFTLLKNMTFLKNTDMSHMWYMPVILGIYLLLPFVANALQNSGARFQKIIFIIAFSYLFVVPEVNVIFQSLNIESLNALLDVSFVGGAYGLCVVMGYFSKKNYFEKKPIVIWWILTIVGYFATVILQLFAYKNQVGYNVWYNNATLVMCAYGIFELSKHYQIPSNRIVSNLSLCSFGIFLVHNPINMVLLQNLTLERYSIKLLIAFIITLIVSWAVVAIFPRKKMISKLLFYK